MTNKIKQYKEKMFEFIKKSFPNLSDDQINDKLDDIIEDKDEQNQDIFINIKFFDQVTPDVGTTIDKLESNLEKRKVTITKYGTTYKNQEVQEALEAKMLDFTGIMRSKEKDEMFKHINDENPTIMKRHNSKQKTYKASIMNSYYGVLTTNGSSFRDLDCGESVTAAGEEIIMTAIDTFEKFLTANIHFYSPSNVIDYIINILNDDYNTELNLTIDKEILVNHLSNYFYDDDYFKIKYDLSNNEMVMNFINKLTPNELAKVYYKNNLYQFLIDSKLYKEFQKILKDKENLFLDPNKPNDFQKSILDHIWNYVKDWVFYNHLDINKYDFCKNGKRKTVLTVKLCLPL